VFANCSADIWNYLHLWRLSNDDVDLAIGMGMGPSPLAVIKSKQFKEKKYVYNDRERCL
jgi:hypothetical protein